LQSAITAQKQQQQHQPNNNAEVFSTKKKSHLFNFQQFDSFDEFILHSSPFVRFVQSPSPSSSSCLIPFILLFIQLVCSIWYISILALFTKNKKKWDLFFVDYFV